MGPHCAGAFDPRNWASETGMITLEVMGVVLAVGLFAIGVELPGSYVRKHVRGLLALVIPTMAIGWFVVAGVYSSPSLWTLDRTYLPRILVPALPIAQLYILLGYICLSHPN